MQPSLTLTQMGNFSAGEFNSSRRLTDHRVNSKRPGNKGNFIYMLRNNNILWTVRSTAGRETDT